MTDQPLEHHGDSFLASAVELVDLSRAHPGFDDPAYRQRRNQIARLALEYRDRAPIPSIDYDDHEHQVWHQVWSKLAPLHETWAGDAYLDGRRRFEFDRQRIPSFSEVNHRLGQLSGFQMVPVAGLVVPRTFLEQLAHGRFLATQYVRHPSDPLHTPEPDVIHEYIGHVPTLVQAELAQLNRAFGHAAYSATTPERIEALIRVYWFTIEFGLVADGERVKVMGAGLLSSAGEIQRFSTSAQLLEWDLERMAHTSFDPTNFQDRLFVAPSYREMLDDLRAWLEG